MDYLQIRELYHDGIKGMKWGLRRYQNYDGTLTEEGRRRYNKNYDDDRAEGSLPSKDKDGNFTGKRKLRDAGAGLKALESLCKYLGFSSPQSEEKKYIDAKIITISNLDDKKI